MHILGYIYTFCQSPELEFLNSLWGLGTEQEQGYRTGPPDYISWRNSFLVIDSWAPQTFKNTGSAMYPRFLVSFYHRVLVVDPGSQSGRRGWSRSARSLSFCFLFQVYSSKLVNFDWFQSQKNKTEKERESQLNVPFKDRERSARVFQSRVQEGSKRGPSKYDM